ncbi:alanine--glyoxylate aminotransferase family protein [Sansalvadorimonas sp. 2012CJ34-2]|uniref:Alanine--glyoxylate aminotransferase family protein n=2 Tax=Parendozoicomonas callyspongiae TaxID=2942213 RepID=A0ABT0PDT1_9GAMM|nr:alanine--glyoxylate aminotransferase family protein [Sansalvadorimonas sp. 2012CJ34-2]MCL6268708.1 alanine--glyoxylate aminotransferase family protein [Sansalvadorimonas sp. 2012CJ34-2]
MNPVDIPSVTPLDQILPDEPLLLMGAGPVPVPAKVAAANTVVINHLGSTMARILDQVKSMARYVFQTRSEHIMGVAGPGSAAMEMAITNLVWPGTKVLSINNGFFSGRLAEMAERVGGDVTRVQVPDCSDIDPDELKKLFSKQSFDVLTLVQGETSNTVWNRQLAQVCQLAKQHNTLVVVDAVCTLSTMPLDMDQWEVDAIITGGQKGLSSIPGVSLIAFSQAAWQRIESRTEPMPHWCLDARLARQFWHQKGYHYTAPVSGLLALHEALRLICEESLQGRILRHKRCSSALQNAIESMGLDLYVPKQARLPSVIGIELPADVNGPQLLEHISTVHRVEIAGSFGPNIVRIGQMGEQCRSHHLFRTVHALGASMQTLGAKVDVPAGVAELERSLNHH